MSPTLRSALLTAAAAASVACVSCQSLAQSWTQFQGDASHRAFVNTFVDATSIHPVWSKTVGQLNEQNMILGAVTDGSHVYLSARRPTGSPTGFELLALNPADGGVAWRRGFDSYAGDFSAPSVGNNKVYVHQWGHSGISGGNASQYPYVWGLNASDGAVSFATSHSGQWSSGSRPAVIGTQVFAAGGYYGGLDAYNGVAGGTQWNSPANQQYGWIPAADSQRVYVYMGSASASPGPQVGSLFGYDRTTGVRTLTIQNPQDDFTLYGQLTVIGNQNDAVSISRETTGLKLVRFDLNAQNITWRYPIAAAGSVAISGGTVFAANGIELTLLDELTGARTNGWFAPPSESLAGNLLVTPNLVFAQTNQATYAISRGTLQTVWSTPLTGDLALGDGLLLIHNTNSINAFAIPAPGPCAMLLVAGLGMAKRRRR